MEGEEVVLDPSGNNKRSDLVAEILEQLNDSNNEFWSNTHIQNKLQRVVTRLYNQNDRLNSERHQKTYDFKYQASEEYMLVNNQIEITSSNKWIDVDLGAGEVSVALAEKVYNNFGLLKDEIASKLQTLDATFSCEYSHTTNKFTIARTGNFTIKWATGSHTGSTFGEVIGFDVSADDNGANASFLADNTKELTQTPRIKILMLEDRTDRQPGPLWYPSEALDQQHMYNWVLQSAEYYDEMPKYKVMYTYFQFSSSSYKTADLQIYASPIPKSTRSLRLYYQGVPPTLNADVVRSGLLPEEEEVAVIRTCILAKFQEVDKAPRDWKEQLKDAELNMRQAIRPLKRGPKRVIYIPD
jgi:hypothetical protein